MALSHNQPHVALVYMFSHICSLHPLGGQCGYLALTACVCVFFFGQAGSTLGWDRYAHASIGVDRFGLSGPYKDVRFPPPVLILRVS